MYLSAVVSWNELLKRSGKFYIGAVFSLNIGHINIEGSSVAEEWSAQSGGPGF